MTDIAFDARDRRILTEPTATCLECGSDLCYFEDVPTRRSVQGVVDDVLVISQWVDAVHDDLGFDEHLFCSACSIEYSLDGVEFRFNS